MCCRRQVTQIFQDFKDLDVSMEDGVPRIDFADPRLSWVCSNYSMNEICASLEISPDLVKMDFGTSWPDKIHYYFK